LFREDLLRRFDDLDPATVTALLTDFYYNKYAEYYEYDFSLISKHALSQVYEHYVSLLRFEESPQVTLPLFQQLPEEERNKLFGSIYTPQYIARFFGRYLRAHMTPPSYARIKAVDPACGSGIFLRTLLELQFDQPQLDLLLLHLDLSQVGKRLEEESAGNRKAHPGFVEHLCGVVVMPDVALAPEHP
jgi:hypothetical protein